MRVKATTKHISKVKMLTQIILLTGLAFMPLHAARANDCSSVFECANDYMNAATGAQSKFIDYFSNLTLPDDLGGGKFAPGQVKNPNLKPSIPTLFFGNGNPLSNSPVTGGDTGNNGNGQIVVPY